jgi:hypothetical protein
MCGCGGASLVTSGPINAEPATVIARPNNGEAREFVDRVAAEAYVTALGGGVVVPAQPAAV